MDGGMPRHTLEAAGNGEQLLDALVLLLHFLEHRALFERLGEGHVERRRHSLGHAIGVGVRNVDDTRDVADDGASFHGPERDDLGDVLACRTCA